MAGYRYISVRVLLRISWSAVVDCIHSSVAFYILTILIVVIVTSHVGFLRHHLACTGNLACYCPDPVSSRWIRRLFVVVRTKRSISGMGYRNQIYWLQRSSKLQPCNDGEAGNDQYHSYIVTHIVGLNDRCWRAFGCALCCSPPLSFKSRIFISSYRYRNLWYGLRYSFRRHRINNYIYTGTNICTCMINV